MINLTTSDTTFKQEIHTFDSMIEAENFYNRNKNKAWILMLNDMQVSFNDLQGFAVIERSKLNYLLFNYNSKVAFELPIRATSDHRLVESYVVKYFPLFKLGVDWDYKSNSEAMKLHYEIVDLSTL